MTLDQVLDRADGVLTTLVAITIGQQKKLLHENGIDADEAAAHLARIAEELTDWKAEELAKLRRELQQWIETDGATVH
jgi:hypothetical protein